ncbi:hypothetical protein [Paenibacillus montanisoli]|uniref:Diacylglyceryl transferase n=1 Tax=Paenibacillus montanisoli TaxID=2081970 RepID=A0A328U0C4_9BACL|nr:hypothetical protein [Paenibacillus montanisoli]RAP75223.1 hypothetical protein DL346_17765 [Paenibacillus montanisoli]
MTEPIAIGPLRLDAMMLAAIGSAAAGLAILKLWLARSPFKEERYWFELAVNAMIWILIGWKLAFLLREPEVLWERPSALIIVRGSGSDTAVGMLLAIVYLGYATRKRRIKALKLLDVLPFALLPACIVWTLITDRWYGIPYAILLAAVYGVLFRTGAAGRAGSGETASLALLGTGIGGLVVSLFAPYPPGELPMLTFGLTTLQWLFILMSLLGIGLPTRRSSG